MKSASADTLDSQSPASARDVARGIMRLFARNNIWCISEMPLKNGRRADLMGIDAKGLIVIVEIKVARGDLLGDAKWPDYLDFCDRFYWGLAPGLNRDPLASEAYRPDVCGIVVADGYDAEIVQHASLDPLAPARRKTQVEALARAAMRRHTSLIDPHCSDVDSAG
ncbi:MmcB family DNA repair protein [Erythrobacter ani]|uniref:MmcB family DNA repair protein n=1 Tax=Erythrobacter ani TaxID=2827235 RepID=A0ABS6SKF9_9SPHN|nr:MmcB family DNA repair protein [Erythrobacter ani]MBV7265503.1 MmcB family DNA repair protein [Erythrobacter ani]